MDNIIKKEVIVKEEQNQCGDLESLQSNQNRIEEPSVETTVAKDANSDVGVVSEGHEKSQDKDTQLDANLGKHQDNTKIGVSNLISSNQLEDAAANVKGSPINDEDDETEDESREVSLDEVMLRKQALKPRLDVGNEDGIKVLKQSHSWETDYDEGYESGTEEEQYAFRKEVETFHRERNLEFKAPKFYKEELNLLKLYRAVIKLGGYEQVTSCKLWRNVGAPFRPPKTCTTVSWTFRNFYEKSLLEYEKHRMRCGELPFSEDSFAVAKAANQVTGGQAIGSGRALRDAAARARQGWHSHRYVNDEVCDPLVLNDGKSSFSPKSDKQLRGNLKRKGPFTPEHSVQARRMKASKPQVRSLVVDVGLPADWVKINVYKINDCFEVYALVPGLMREEIHVQSDPAGHLIITGQPEQLDNPWGITPFKKVVSLPTRIDPHQTTAVVTLNGQLFVRVPVDQTDL